MMGSGGMIVMDEDNCMVDMARYFVQFLQEESCGKCTPCREGLQQMGEILNRICDGKGKEEDIKLLEDLSQVMLDTSLCGLGLTAPNPVLSTIQYFRNEYEAHIKEKQCPAKVCKELISFSIDSEKCTGCGACVRVCPVDAIAGEKKKPHQLDQNKCIKCRGCFEACKLDAVVIQ
jgi:NAD-dependent dihydropyrimidine dehydrogenase PreA subunit